MTHRSPVSDKHLQIIIPQRNSSFDVSRVTTWELRNDEQYELQLQAPSRRLIGAIDHVSQQRAVKQMFHVSDEKIVRNEKKKSPNADGNCLTLSLNDGSGNRKPSSAQQQSQVSQWKRKFYGAYSWLLHFTFYFSSLIEVETEKFWGEKSRN